MTIEFVLPIGIFSVNFCEENGSIPRTGYYLIKNNVTRNAYCYVDLDCPDTMIRTSIYSNREYLYEIIELKPFFFTLTCLSCVQGKNLAAKILALCPEWIVMTFLPVKGLVIAKC